MKIFKCDRCGKNYRKNSDIWELPLTFRVTWNYKEIDLCDDCFEKLQKWIEWIDNTHDEQKESEEK